MSERTLALGAADEFGAGSGRLASGFLPIRARIRGAVVNWRTCWRRGIVRRVGKAWGYDIFECLRLEVERVVALDLASKRSEWKDVSDSVTFLS